MQKNLLDNSRRNFIIEAPLVMTGFISGCASSQSNLTLQQPIADEKPWTGKPVFSIVDVQVNDGKAFGEYVVGHSATVAEAGGKFLAAGARGESIEGTRKPRNIVIHQWPSAQTFFDWYNGAAYSQWKPKRYAASSADVILIQGLIDSERSETFSPAFTIVDIEVRDPQVFGRYVQGHMQSLSSAGGVFLAAGGRIQVIEGTWSPKRVILHRWPDEMAFRNWYKSDEYRPWRELRHSVSSANVVLANGLSDAQKIQRKMP
jgi:uncharacterized protein (DUF1330 family)